MMEQWQSDAKHAFEWIQRLYEQAQSLFDDGDAYLEEQGWEVHAGKGFGGTAMAWTNLREWPFAYFVARGATRAGENSPRCGLFYGVSFHDSTRPGPSLVVGRAAWVDDNVNFDHWVILAAIGGDAPKWIDGAYEVGPGPLHTSRPTIHVPKNRRGIGDVRWFEVPLSTVSSAERLRLLLDAGAALVAGDETAALACALAPADK